MGDRESNNRIPTVDEGTATYTWEYLRTGEHGVGATVEHTHGESYFTVEFLGDEVRIPRQQARWLAEVLLQLSDQYRELIVSAVLDDYNRSDLPIGDRR